MHWTWMVVVMAFAGLAVGAALPVPEAFRDLVFEGAAPSAR